MRHVRQEANKMSELLLKLAAVTEGHTEECRCCKEKEIDRLMLLESIYDKFPEIFESDDVLEAFKKVRKRMQVS